MFNDTVTIFNRWRSTGLLGEMWYPTVLHGVELQTDRAAIVAKYGDQCADRALLFVHYQTDEEGRKMVGGKEYLPPRAWNAEGEPDWAVTFAPGEAFDFFVEGAWPDETPVLDSDYPRGFFDHMNRTRDGVYAVTQASVFKVIPHIEVVGR